MVMKKKVIRGVTIGIGIVFVLVGWYVAGRINQRSKIVIQKENEIVISTFDTEDISLIAEQWVHTYIGQYQQKELYNFEQITHFEIQEITVLDSEKNIVQIDFEATKKRKYSNLFRKMDWGIEDKKKITGQWVLYFEKEKKQYHVALRQRLAAYQLSSGHESGAFDKEQTDIQNQTEYEKKRGICSYKIEKGILYLSYDNQKNWIAIPPENTPDTGYSPYLEEGYYQISNEVTILADQNHVWYSKDAGRTFKEIYQSDDALIHHVYFTSQMQGYVFKITGNALGGVIGITIQKTEDGGQTWKKVSDGPGFLHTTSQYFWVNDQIGFICDTKSSSDSGVLYRTQDGFQTFSIVTFPSGIIDTSMTSLSWNEIYDTPGIPFKQGSTLSVYVGQGTDGDYKGASLALYESYDNGITWNFKKEVKPQELEEG